MERRKTMKGKKSEKTFSTFFPSDTAYFISWAILNKAEAAEAAEAAAAAAAAAGARVKCHRN